MLRLHDMSIKAKLLALVALGTLGLLVVLGLAGRMLATFQINGPLYERIIKRREVEAEVKPSTFDVMAPYLMLHELAAAADAQESNRLLGEYRALEKEYQDRKAFWRRELFEGPTKQALEHDVFPAADEFYRLVDEEYLPAVKNGDQAAAKKVFDTRVRPQFQAQRRAVIHTSEIADEVTRRQEAE